MAVIINEFEIVAEPVAPTPPPPAPAQAQEPAPTLPAQEVERALRHERERALRQWAH